MPVIRGLKAKAAKLKRETWLLYFAARDPRTPWYAKAFIACVVAYALSPIDLIPDPIPFWATWMISYCCPLASI